MYWCAKRSGSNGCESLDSDSVYGERCKFTNSRKLVVVDSLRLPVCHWKIRIGCIINLVPLQKKNHLWDEWRKMQNIIDNWTFHLFNRKNAEAYVYALQWSLKKIINYTDLRKKNFEKIVLNLMTIFYVLFGAYFKNTFLFFLSRQVF